MTSFWSCPNRKTFQSSDFLETLYLKFLQMKTAAVSWSFSPHCSQTNIQVIKLKIVTEGLCQKHTNLWELEFSQEPSMTVSSLNINNYWTTELNHKKKNRFQMLKRRSQTGRDRRGGSWNRRCCGRKTRDSKGWRSPGGQVSVSAGKSIKASNLWRETGGFYCPMRSNL